jgi:hypothetical protein
MFSHSYARTQLLEQDGQLVNVSRAQVSSQQKKLAHVRVLSGDYY